MSYSKSCLASLILIFVAIHSYAQEAVNPYNPEPRMAQLKVKNGEVSTQMHFLVFGDSKGSKYFSDVLKCADSLQPDFCLTTGDLVDQGGGEQGKLDYALLDEQGGWFLRKYPTWPVIANHELNGGDDALENFIQFFGLEKTMYNFDYGNATFIALPWAKISSDSNKLEWLEEKLKEANGKHIFIFKHRPDYTLGSKHHDDVEGEETETTKLFDKYNVTAVFSGHDHIYYRTKRNNTHYIISSGAGAGVYPLRREQEAIENDVYFGRRTSQERKDGSASYKFHAADGATTNLADAIYYVLSVKIDGKQVSIELIDATGKVWDKADIK